MGAGQNGYLGQSLRSMSPTDLSPPQLRTKFGERAFSHAGPAALNSMPKNTSGSLGMKTLVAWYEQQPSMHESSAPSKCVCVERS